ncbi:phosphotransferase enzyme family protein [Paraphoma chrysanthemicola]|uniref:Phosphotransferase enzyme family protein n=1 Tax=Paraphoma chrysanthemicola TaxID=798071 RepID=A0A8K0RDB4_9PLEO|nr:phosphotransferase enzyme family protein [Paraphoma chrysanthemicola]
MTAKGPQISLAELPDSSQPHIDFLDSTWFKTHGRTQQFPAPEHLRTLFKPHQLPKPVRFEDLGLIVKFGRHVSTTEAINLWAIRRVFRDIIPVPEVYGWRVFERDGMTEVFIYMQLIQGPTLQQQWPELSATDKHTICGDLRAMVSCLRNLQDGEPQQVIGTICHGPGIDLCLEDLPLLRPFPSRAVFHDWFSWLWRRHVPDPQSIEDPWRDLLLDNGPVVFTHGDLRPANIIVTATSPVRVVAIVDWEMAGWYPDYWEYCKARFTTSYTEEWCGWIDQFLVPHLEALEAFDFYTITLGKI